MLSYARARVPEYRVIDVEGRRAVVRRNLDGGVQRDLTAHTDTATIAPHARPEATVPVADLLP
ncbi:MAG: hypothetical protein R2729_22500 [Bryobacteraceae bacterium]